MEIINVSCLDKNFTTKNGKVEALKNINLSIEQGEIFGIIGMSGAGKSTLVRCLNYLEKPDEGRVTVDGDVLGDLTEAQLRKKRESIAMIFQGFNLLMQKTVADNVMFPLLIRNIKKQEARKTACELLKTVDLIEKQNDYPAQLSGGQKQRVAIARALACNPKILLCDEATSALDPQTTASILELLSSINKNFKITIVIITHQMSVVRKICSRVAIMSSGEVVEQGTVSDIFSHPKTDAARKLIHADIVEESEEITSGKDMEVGKKIRIVFSQNSAFEPVIANMVLRTGAPVNILKADTREVSGFTKGEMILGLPQDTNIQREIEKYLCDCGLEIEEVK